MSLFSNRGSRADASAGQQRGASLVDGSILIGMIASAPFRSRRSAAMAEGGALVDASSRARNGGALGVGGVLVGLIAGAVIVAVFIVG